MRPREYRVSDAALQRARQAGLTGDLEKRLSRMALRSAPFTSDVGNRRFDDFVLKVDGDIVLDVQRFEIDG